MAGSELRLSKAGREWLNKAFPWVSDWIPGYGSNIGGIISQDGFDSAIVRIHHDGFFYVDYTVLANEPNDIFDLYASCDSTGFSIGLPHQCDDWEITAVDIPSFGTSSPIQADQAIARLRAFLREGQCVLNAIEMLVAHHASIPGLFNQRVCLFDAGGDAG